MKDNLIFPASIFIIGVAALFFIVVSGSAAVPDCTGTGVCSWLIKDDYSQVYRGLVVNTYGATTGLIVRNGNVGIKTTGDPAYELDVLGTVRANGGLIIDVRTANPASPVAGQMWLIQ